MLRCLSLCRYLHFACDGAVVRVRLTHSLTHSFTHSFTHSRGETVIFASSFVLDCLLCVVHAVVHAMDHALALDWLSTVVGQATQLWAEARRLAEQDAPAGGYVSCYIFCTKYSIFTSNILQGCLHSQPRADPAAISHHHMGH